MAVAAFCAKYSFITNELFSAVFFKLVKMIIITDDLYFGNYLNKNVQETSSVLVFVRLPLSLMSCYTDITSTGMKHTGLILG